MYPFRRSQLTCGLVYLQVTSPFSFWNSQGTTMTVSPSRIQTLFLILPLMRHILVTLSWHWMVKWLAPSIFATIPKTSPSPFLGVLTLVMTSPTLLAGFLPPRLYGLFNFSPSRLLLLYNFFIHFLNGSGILSMYESSSDPAYASLALDDLSTIKAGVMDIQPCSASPSLATAGNQK